MRRLPTLLVAIFVVGLGSCKDSDSGTQNSTATGAKSVADPGTTADLEPPARDDDKPTFRLDDRAAPLAYDVGLTLDPSSEEFTGRVAIEIDIKKETNVIWMHGRDLTIETAVLKVGDRELSATSETGENHLLGFRFAEVIKPGRATLEVSYAGKIVRKDGAGIFAEKDGEHWYQYTQFESLDARRAFPCFDEPRWKTPWKLALTVGKDLVAVANTPIENETVSGANKTVTFVETKPLPTYLVSFGTGPFEFVDAGKSKSGIKMRIVVPKGRTAEAAYAAKVNRPILAALESYFGRPYPYRKLDTLIIPTTQGFGAMEHPGLITFASRLALWKRSQATFERERRFALVQAHEMGHQWFGNLVTMPWWDDIWLNEAFASWIENRVLDRWRPAWRLEAVSMDSKEAAMASDMLASARQIREPVNDESGVRSAFDRITYQKGESVINMFETYVGKAAWKKAINSYLNKYEWKTATAKDFLAAISESTGKDVTTPFNTFLEQNGIPLLSMKLRCEKGAAPAVMIEQSRYLAAGSKAPSARKWQIPVCVSHSRGSACMLLKEKTGELALGKVGARCPAWVNPNKGGVGYYRAEIGREMRAKLAALKGRKLSLAERLSLAGDVRALAQSGALKLDEAFGHVRELASSKDAVLNLAGVELAKSLFQIVAVADRARYGEKVREVFAPLVKRVKWEARRGEAPQVAELRPALMGMYGGLGEDVETIKTAIARTKGWLAGSEKIAPDLIGAVLALAARNGDKELLDKIAARAAATDNRIERYELLYAIGHFRGEVTKSALAVALSDKIDARDALSIIEAAGWWPETQAQAVKFITANYDKLAERLSESQLAYLPEEMKGVCDAELRKQMASFFAERTAKLRGGALALKQTIERIDLCIAARAAHSKMGSKVAPAK